MTIQQMIETAMKAAGTECPQVRRMLELIYETGVCDGRIAELKERLK